MERLTHKTRYVAFGIVFLFYLYIAFNMALTQDDWTWGSSVGWERMQHGFSNYNGRYLGNLLEILITRNLAARVLAMSLFCTGVFYLLWRLIDLKQLHCGLLLFFLILSLPAKVFAQTYGWGAGFANYITAAFFSLLYLNIIKNVLDGDEPTYPRGSWIWMVPLGIGSQLFIEHVTLYNIFAAALVMLYTFIRYRKVYLLHVTYFISVIIGAVIMFSNSGYRTVVSGNYKGRSIALTEHEASLVNKMIHAAAHIYPHYILNNTILILVLSFAGIWLLQTHPFKVLSWFLSLILGAYPVYKIIWISNFHVRFSGARILEGLFSFVYVVTLFVVICVSVKGRTKRNRAIFFLISSAVLAMPFLVVTPLSPRCFLSSYFMMALVAVELLNSVIQPGIRPVVIRGAGVCSVAMMVMYLGVFNRIGHTTEIRNQEIKDQLAKQSTVIYVTKYRYTQFMQHSVPKKGTLPYITFNLYYHIPKNVTVKFKS
ncbi:DUF6056 family protein [Pullulanibacillus sp. KACC 23026]|uniref:DUF6056 family protein n=1 Tax=Pullulanibacillus sp. KACC 23026 TaxID=3028315 RepID=UPI0023B1BD60|nr:DUF6056 family protein [Pullulanibacillus sp. KACC 23026]WEG12193.1 DUF6056 family protein [Pullulanibacillus sp. KACC 23026]